MSSVGYEAINIDENSIPRDHMANAMIDSQLHECVRQDNTAAFKSLVEQHLTEKLVTPCGNTLLHVAVSCGSDNITSYLAPTFPSLITIQNSQKDTILHLAAREGKASDAIKSLAESNPSLMRKTNTKGNTPLHDAVITDNKEVAIFLASRDPEVAYYSNKNGRSPLYLAVENGNKNGILDDLLDLGASIPITREDDLLEKIAKAKPELLCLTDEELGNSLHYASSICFLEGRLKNGQGNVVRYILENDQKIVEPLLNEMDEDGNTPLHLAARHGQSMAAFVLVRDKRVENSIVNNENCTPYDVAKQQSQKAVDQYDKTDDMLAKEREQFDSKNSIPADEIQDKAVDSKHYKLLDYYGTMTTLSILYFHARPEKSLYERFTRTQGKQPRKQETRIRIQNLLLV
uniref:Uncharacterized protein n=1 Tax=Populus alba TaxID=43335 RepID=A0A4U5NPH0_POPAL|nr:hypothetical protein D5086_0000254420 [Populus alba]